jgi:uncharacterized damage-inducible protein DinB
MNPPLSTLDEALLNWQDTREGLIEEVQNIPAAKFDFRPVPEVRSVRELVQHILEVAMMMTGELSREDTDFHRAPWPKLLRMHAAVVSRTKTKAELVRLLRSQHKEAEKRFRAVGEIGMLQLITNFDGSRGTRLAWFGGGVAHEMYHRGQLTLYARCLGLEPALTRRIRGG